MYLSLVIPQHFGFWYISNNTSKTSWVTSLQDIFGLNNKKEKQTVLLNYISEVIDEDFYKSFIRVKTFVIAMLWLWIVNWKILSPIWGQLQWF